MKEHFVNTSKNWTKYLPDLRSGAGSARCDCFSMIKNLFEISSPRRKSKKSVGMVTDEEHLKPVK